MGQLITKVFDNLFPKRNCRIIMLGLDAAGKTTILYNLKIGEVVQSVPTIGFNTETVEYKNIKFQVWDIGGQGKIRDLWFHYFEGAECLIYVVDSSDEKRLEEVKQTLFEILQNEQLRNVPVLLFANKQDQAQLTIPQIADKLNLRQLRQIWHIQGTCALNGQGLHDGLDWVAKQLSKKH